MKQQHHPMRTSEVMSACLLAPELTSPVFEHDRAEIAARRVASPLLTLHTER